MLALFDTVERVVAVCVRRSSCTALCFSHMHLWYTAHSALSAYFLLKVTGCCRQLGHPQTQHLKSASGRSFIFIKQPYAAARVSLCVPFHTFLPFDQTNFG